MFFEKNKTPRKKKKNRKLNHCAKTVRIQKIPVTISNIKKKGIKGLQKKKKTKNEKQIISGTFGCKQKKVAIVFCFFFFAKKGIRFFF